MASVTSLWGFVPSSIYATISLVQALLVDRAADALEAYDARQSEDLGQLPELLAA